MDSNLIMSGITGARNGTALTGINVCQPSNISLTPQLRIQNQSVANISFASGNPPFRLSGTPRRHGTFLCQVHAQSLNTSWFLWNVTTTTNATALNLTSGDLTTNPYSGSNSPVFQIGDVVQWTAHEIAAQPDGMHRYFKSENFTITTANGSTEYYPPQSGGLRVAEAGMMGWLVGGLLLSLIAVVGV